MLEILKINKVDKSTITLQNHLSHFNQKPLSYTLDFLVSAFSEVDPFTLSDATQGVQIFGAIGSGKTSGSGRFLAESFLKAGFGGLVLTVKNDERELWEKYCKDSGRELLIFSPQEAWRFNFLEYEMKRGGRGAGQTENIVDLFTSVLNLEGEKGGDKANNFWDQALKQLIRNAVELIKLADENLSVVNLYKVISSAPQEKNQTMAIEQENGEVGETTWMKTSFCANLIFKAYNRQDLTESQQKDLESVKDYWTIDFAGLNEKTRSIITFSFTGLADVFLRGDLRELFTTSTNIFPEFTHNGAVILLDLPVHEYGKTGQFVQSIFKYVWQKATERRTKSDDMTPVFLWADEAQFFINSHDVKFQTTARSSRACTVYLTQNLPNYISALGENLTYSLLGNLQTKIFHQNSETKTNKYASEIIGQNWQDVLTTSSNKNPDKDLSSNRGTSFNEQVQYQILPIEFTKLAKGGFETNLLVQGVVFQGGRIWQVNGYNFLTVLFEQN